MKLSAGKSTNYLVKIKPSYNVGAPQSIPLKRHSFASGWAQEVGFTPPAKAIVRWRGLRFFRSGSGIIPYFGRPYSGYRPGLGGIQPPFQ